MIVLSKNQIIKLHSQLIQETGGTVRYIFKNRLWRTLAARSSSLDYHSSRIAPCHLLQEKSLVGFLHPARLLFILFSRESITPTAGFLFSVPWNDRGWARASGGAPGLRLVAFLLS